MGILIAALILLGIYILFTVLRRNKGRTGSVQEKGFQGEQGIVGKLSKVKGYHKILTNVYIPRGVRDTTEVDVIFIHPTGVYVIESKNFRGLVKGRESDEKWLQYFLDEDKQFTFYNPIRQNNGHIAALKNLLCIKEDYKYKSVIVFGDNCNIEGITLDTDKTVVTKRREIHREIQKCANKAHRIFENEDINQIYNKLKPYSEVSDEIKQQHIENVTGWRKQGNSIGR